MMNCEMTMRERRLSEEKNDFMREKRLYEASLGGDITSLMELLKEDPLILERVITSFTETPLHIAAMSGHIDFVNELLRRKPQLTSESDSHGFSPLHLAASRKNIDMVKLLLAANSNACSMTDKEGRTPLHLAAMKGRIEAMKELISTCPGAIQMVADRGETILHLCVKHNRLEALKLLLEELNNNKGGVPDDSSSISINSKDADGNTILHLAVAKKHWEMINFLLNKSNNSTKGIEVNALNKSGFTSLDVLVIQSARDLKDIEILELLSGAGCVRAASSPANNVSVLPLIGEQRIPQTVPTPTPTPIDNSSDEKFEKWVENKRSSLMVVAILIATMAFQTALSPPGGVWGSDSAAGPSPIEGENNNAHHSGMSVLAESGFLIRRIFYSGQVFLNTIGFVASLSIILLLLSGLPFIKRKFFVWILTITLWIALGSMALSYSFILVLTREHGSRAPKYVIFAWMGLMFLIIICHFSVCLGRCCCKIRPTNYTRMRHPPA